MKKRKITMAALIAGICLLIVFAFAACSNEEKASSDYPQTPQEVIEMYVKYRYSSDVRGMFNVMGIAWDDAYEIYEDQASEYAQEEYTVTVDNIQLEKLVGDDFDTALADITEYWLNDDDNNYEFVYTAFDIQEIGYASFTLINQTLGETHRAEDVCIVKTDLGWFMAVGGI